MPPAVLVTLFVALAAWSWRRWADPIVDFGNEPYVAWQLLEGRALYRDIAWLYGPLSPWLNAVSFRLFGASLATLAACNLVVAAVLALVVYRFCAKCSDTLTATVATSVLLVSFVFPHHSDDAGNYNFVWPYAYAATHGAVLLVCGVAALSRAVVTDRVVAWAGAGFLLGLTLLTKAEIALAAGATGALATLWRLPDGRPRPLAGLVAFAAGCVVPVAACWSMLGSEAVIAPWMAVVRVVGGEHAFNAHLMGTDDLGGNSWRLGIDSAVWSVLASAIVAADVYAAGLAPERKRWLVIGAVAVVGACLVRDLPGVGRSLPVLIPLAMVALVWVARRRPDDRGRMVPLVLWGTAAWALLARMLLDVHLHHYGFYLCMPAAVFVVVLSVGTVPRLLAERAVEGGRIVRPVALATIGLLLLYSTALSAASYAHVTVPIGRDRDAMYAPSPLASPTGVLAAALVERIVSQVPPHATLAVLPDGTLMNFLTRRPNPTPYHQLMPPTLVAYGVVQVLTSYEARSPDYVVLYEWPGDEYGVGAFGSRQWGAEIVAWVERRYERVSAVPSSGTTIGFALWHRRAAS
jgi:4-amino-4-deoxy-L-arabinose transferase-like glycosyltransferase